MAHKNDAPPAYGSPTPQPPPQAHAAYYPQNPSPYPDQQQYGPQPGHQQQQYGPPPGAQQQQYYQPGPQMGYYPPQQQGMYPPQQGGYYPAQQQPQGYYRDDRRQGPGMMEACLASLACCCCLDLCLF